MKKIFTLFMATVVAMSVMALPQNANLAGKKSAPASKSQLEAKTPAQAKALELHKASIAERDFARPEGTKKVAALASTNAPKKVANAKSEVINITFDAFAVEPTYYPETGDWYMACANETYTVKLDYYGPAESPVGTWTTEDFDLGYSYMYVTDEEGWTSYVDYESIECTLSEVKLSQYLTKMVLVAVIEGSDGNTYNVSCEQFYFQPKDTVNTAITNATLVADGGQFVLAGKNENIDVNLTVLATQPIGSFTLADYDMAGSTIVCNGVEQKILSSKLTVSVAKTASVVGYVADLSFFNQDTILYNVSMISPLPAPTDTVEITMNNLSVDDSWVAWTGWVYLTATNAEWDIYAGIAAMQAEAGTWTGEKTLLYITDMNTYDAPQSLYSEITLSEAENGGWKVLATGYCDDGKYYVVNMEFVVPEPEVFKTITFDNCASAAYYPDLSNDLQLMNENEEYTIAVDIYGVEMGASFTMANVDANYSGVIDNGEEVQVADITGKVYQVGDTTRIDAVIIGFNAVQYTVELWYAVPTPTETKEFTVEGADFVNYIADQGLYQLYGYAENGVDFVSLAIMADEVAGTYINDGMFSRFGAEGGRYDLYTNYNYVIKVINPETEEYEKYMIEKGTVVVTVDENNVITATVDAICSNAVRYLITVTSEYNTHLMYDSEEPVERIYTAADELEVTWIEDYGYMYIDLWGANGEDLAELLFFVEAPDAEIAVPEGTYTIDNSMDYGTVFASQGVEGSSVYPSFYALLTEDGYLVDPLWFMVSGTVTVSKTDAGNLNLEVNAVNSYNQTVHIVYNGDGTGVENINVNVEGVKKQIIDGQLVIIRDGKAFNAMGTQVK